MVLPLLAPLIGAGAGLAGALINSNAAREQSDRQYDLARNSVKYRVEDAKNAGISPLYAMGAPTLSSSFQVGDVGGAMADAGQNLGRAASAYFDKSQESSSFQKSVQHLQLQKMGLENQILASNLRLINQPGSPPRRGSDMLLDGQVSSSGGGNKNSEDLIMPLSTLGFSPKFRTGESAQAQQVENHYGEVAGDTYGILRLADDILRPTTRWVGKKLKQVGQNLGRDVLQFYARNNFFPLMSLRR